jgi:hypothetical protein
MELLDSHKPSNLLCLKINYCSKKFHSTLLCGDPSWGKHCYGEISLFNSANGSNCFLFYVKWRQIKTEWGISGREGEREREKRIKRVGDRVYVRIEYSMG